MSRRCTSLRHCAADHADFILRSISCFGRFHTSIDKMFFPKAKHALVHRHGKRYARVHDYSKQRPKRYPSWACDDPCQRVLQSDRTETRRLARVLPIKRQCSAVGGF